MARLRVRVELNRGGVGVPLHKLASVVHEAERFFEMLAADVHIASEGEWLGFDFDNEALNFTAEFVGAVSQEQIDAFYAAFDGTTSLRRATIAQFTQITEAIGEDELIGFGMYQSDHEPEPTEWRCLSRRDALRIADEMQLLLGAAGEMPQETHLPSVIDAGAGAKLFKDRTQRGAPLPDRIPGLVREIEASLSQRITRIEDNMEMNTQAIKDLRESSAATEESFKGLLNAVENFCGQATRQLERLAPQSPEIPKAIAAAVEALPVEAPVEAKAPEQPAPVMQSADAAPIPVSVSTPAIAAKVAETAVLAATAAPASTPMPAKTAASATTPVAATSTTAAKPAPAEPLSVKPKVTPIVTATPRRNWRAILVAAAAIVILVTAGLLWWPRPSDQSAVGGAPSSVIASTEPSASLAATPSAAPAQNPVVEKTAPIPQISPAPAKTPAASTGQAAESATRTSNEAGSESMQVEMEAQEPVWVMVTDKDGKILIARTLQPNETRTLEITDNSTLRTGNAGGLHLRLNGKDLGRIGPTGKIRDVLFKSGEFKVMTPDAG
jgi:Domain of unknown function (DUF4115)